MLNFLSYRDTDNFCAKMKLTLPSRSVPPGTSAGVLHQLIVHLRFTVRRSRYAHAFHSLEGPVFIAAEPKRVALLLQVTSLYSSPGW